MKSDWNWPSGLRGKVVWKCWQIFNPSDLMTKVNEWHWPLASTQVHEALLSYHRPPLFWKNAVYHLFPIQNPKGPNLTLIKISQSQPRVVIWRYLVEPGHLMLHNKFHGNQHRGSGEEDFKVFYHMWGWPPSWPEDLYHLNTFSVNLCIWNLIKIGPVLSGEKSFENVNKHSIQVTYGQGRWMTLAFGI